MRCIVDECLGTLVVRWLESRGHDVTSIRDRFPRLPDSDILALGVREDRIVITIDKDFGDLVFQKLRPHRGVILLRLSDQRAAARIAALERFLAEVPDDLSSCFVVVTDQAVRVARRSGR